MSNFEEKTLKTMAVAGVDRSTYFKKWMLIYKVKSWMDTSAGCFTIDGHSFVCTTQMI